VPPTNACTQVTRSLAVEIPAPAAQAYDGFTSVWQRGGHAHRQHIVAVHVAARIGLGDCIRRDDGEQRVL
jgi:hypothetical protein